MGTLKVDIKRCPTSECCLQLTLTCFLQHTSNNRHREFVCNNKNYSALDEMITEGSNMKQFVADVVMAHNLLNDNDRTGAMYVDITYLQGYSHGNKYCI